MSFMDLYSLVTELIGQNGRRGALMISIDCSHPDVTNFIDIKTDLNKVTKANISVRISREFMEAVKKKRHVRLHFTREGHGGEDRAGGQRQGDVPPHRGDQLGLRGTRRPVLGSGEGVESSEQDGGILLRGGQPVCEEPLPAGAAVCWAASTWRSL